MKDHSGAREVAQWLRARASFVEDLGSVPRNCNGARTWPEL